MLSCCSRFLECFNFHCDPRSFLVSGYVEFLPALDEPVNSPGEVFLRFRWLGLAFRRDVAGLLAAPAVADDHGGLKRSASSLRASSGPRS
jgi:hypothetical protein